MDLYQKLSERTVESLSSPAGISHEQVVHDGQSPYQQF